MENYEIIIAVLLSFAGAALLIFGIWRYMIAPRRRDNNIDKYVFARYAHRGLHGDGACENSLTAFRRAVESGYGIELDIRMSRDGVLVVHHDATLLRICGIDKKVNELDASELGRIKLSTTDDTVPTLREVLDTVDGRVPLLIEIKAEKDEISVAEKFVYEIEGYKGDFIVESFNPFALKTVRKHRPDIFLGILSTEYTKSEKYRGKPLFFALQHLMLNFLARPDFVAYDKHGYNVFALKMLKKVYKTPMFAWTVKSRAEEEEAHQHGFDTVIFEGYTPEENERMNYEA